MVVMMVTIMVMMMMMTMWNDYDDGGGGGGGDDGAKSMFMFVPQRQDLLHITNSTEPRPNTLVPRYSHP